MLNEQRAAALADCLTVFEEAFDKVAAAATKKKPSGYSSEDDTRPNKSPDFELRNGITAVQRGLRRASAKKTQLSGDLAIKVCALLNKDASPVKYTFNTPRRSPRRTSPQNVGSMVTRGPASSSMRTGSSGLKSATKELSVSFEDHGIILRNMRERIAAKKKKVADVGKVRARRRRPRKPRRKRPPMKKAGSFPF